MPLRFEKRRISGERYESAGVFDVDGDGVPDIVSGAWWYRGPDFEERHRIGEVRAEGEYYDDFSTIPMEIAGSGRPDFVTGGWWGNTLRWRENPGVPGAEWPEHVIAEVGNVETTRAWDVDGDGQVEIVPNTPGGPLRAFKLVGPGKFEAHALWEGPQGHGLGFGDISGDGRGDLVLAGGWLEAPEDPWRGEWRLHAEFGLGRASVPIIVADVNGDGLADLIVGGSHDYGLDWWEQLRDGSGRRKWIRHPIDPFCSQYHDMFWLDIDGDGEPELVTGKRYRAHCGKDPGADDPLGIYYFKWTGEGFAKQVIDFGDPESGGGCGIHFAVADLTGDGRPDIVAPGKDGFYVYFNQGVRC
ncbi:MAG: FG-GAP repeat domain-containing protein [Planctomycetota bacterium]|jgi:hypothetical protein